MADDFKATAEAMFESAFCLGEAGQHRNACYLAGYVVECALKAMLLVRYDLANVPRPAANRGGYRTHDLGQLDALLTDLSLSAEPRVLKYGLPLRVAAGIGAGWSPTHRYDGSRWTASDAYLEEATEVVDILANLELDGVLT